MAASHGLDHRRRRLEPWGCGGGEMEHQFGGGLLVLVEGDITLIAADAIGNAANAALAGGGGGVDGAIHRAGGPAVIAELRARHPYGTPAGHRCLDRCGTSARPLGDPCCGTGLAGAAITASPCSSRCAYLSVLSLAAELGARILTLPAISAGAYGYPIDDAARIAVGTVAESLRAGAPLDRVTFVLYSPRALAVFERALAAFR
jgi:O-acetyl-ADP-ribose deacetylase (regulator of RNase III)